MDITENLVKRLYENEITIKKQIDEIKKLKKQLKELDQAKFMQSVISSANWNAVTKENDALRQKIKELEYTLKVLNGNH